MLRVERHLLGPRIYLFGVRLHEWHLGAALLLALVVGFVFGEVHDSLTAGLTAAAGLWLVAKDWRDLTPSRRDTGSWRLGLHRRPHALRRARPAEPLPAIAALAAAAVGAVNLVSAVTPNIRSRGDLLLVFEPLDALRVFHALAIPASVTLLVVSPYLFRRRLRALKLAVVLLLALAVFDLLKGLDFEEAMTSLGVAGLLWLGRGSFYVEHDPVTVRSAVWRIPLLITVTVLASGWAVWLAAPESTGLGTVIRETADLLVWRPGPLTFHDEVGRLGLAIGLVGLFTLLASAYLLFRPLAVPRDLPDAAVRQAAADLVHAHGADTLAYFKLRHDKHYLFSPDGKAFLGYRIEAGVLLVSGDPVGAAESMPALLRRLSVFAEQRGLRIGAVGVSEELRPLFESLGLRALYIGDEAIVETAAFTLEGRPIRKVRQSVTRLERLGYEVELHELGSLDPATHAELERVSAQWLGEGAERGFSMALGSLRRDEQEDTLIALARDGDGRVRAYLHFVPSFGRPAMSLSAMRRERETPNGLTEFLVVKAIELLRGRGIAEISLNFAAFARVLANPCGRVERLAGRFLSLADDWFQIERLYRFNAKFFPRWEPRYFIYEGAFGFPRTGLAAMWIEGQLPRPPRLRFRRPRSDQAASRSERRSRRAAR